MSSVEDEKVPAVTGRDELRLQSLVHPIELWRFLFRTEKGRFLVGGGVNTAFGYTSFALLYHLFSSVIHYGVIVVGTYAINITFSFLVHKFYAFRSRGPWLQQYLRYYVVYAIPMVLGLVAFSFCIEVLHMSAYLAQALILIVNTMISYVGHKHFSFRQRRTERARV